MTTRKQIMTGAAAAYASIGVVRFPAGAAEFNYRFATEQPANHHMSVRLTEAIDKIRTESGGRLDIKLFPNSVLGGQVQMHAQVRLGAVDFITSSDFILANIVPIGGITGLPFVFPGPKEALAVMAGPLGKYRRSAITKFGVYPFEASWNEGFRQVVNQLRPINVPDDLKGIKLRTPDAPVVVGTFKALGASPTSVSSNEMYVSLQTHLVEGIELPLGAIEAYKIYEVSKYVSYTNHIWTAFTMLANSDSWTKLPKNLQDIVTRNINGAAELDNAEVLKLELSLEAQLQGQGMSFNRPQVAQFQAMVRRDGLYSTWKDTYGSEAWGLLEKSVGKLT